MEVDRGKASYKLSQLDMKFSKGSYDIEMYWFRVMSVDHDWYIGRHTHSAYEFHFVAEGMSTVKTDTDEFIVKKGQFYVTKPGEYHEQVNINGKHYVEYCMHKNNLIHLSVPPSFYLNKHFIYWFSLWCNKYRICSNNWYN